MNIWGNIRSFRGYEFSGVVAAAGRQITRFQAGDQVAVQPNIACDNCVNCLNNRQNFCLDWQAIGVTLPGSMEEYVTVPERAAFSLGEVSVRVVEGRLCALINL